MKKTEVNLPVIGMIAVTMVVWAGALGTTYEYFNPTFQTGLCSASCGTALRYGIAFDTFEIYKWDDGPCDPTKTTIDCYYNTEASSPWSLTLKRPEHGPTYWPFICLYVLATISTALSVWLIREVRAERAPF